MNISEQQPSTNQQDMSAFPAETFADVIADTDTDMSSSEDVANFSEETPEEASDSGSYVEENTGNSSDFSASLIDDPLDLLEARLSSMANTISALRDEVGQLNNTIADRDARIVMMEQNNSSLEQKLALSTSTQGQMVDRLMGMLDRFSDVEVVNETVKDGSVCHDAGLLDETMGTA